MCIIGINLLELENNRTTRTQRNSVQKDDKLFERKKLMNF